MENEFRALVGENDNFTDTTLESFASLPDSDIHIYFDTSTIRGVNFKGKVLALRNRYCAAAKLTGDFSFNQFYCVYTTFIYTHSYHLVMTYLSLLLKAMLIL